MSRKDRFNHLKSVVTSAKFLNKVGLGNELPFFIYPFPACEGFSMVNDREDLIKHAKQKGKIVLDLNLYDISIDILQERGIFEQVLEIESNQEKSEILELLQGVLDIPSHIIPKISDAMNNIDHDMIFISGVGEVYPFIRSHNVLHNLHNSDMNKPIILFFPGEYTSSPSIGASLSLFGMFDDDRYYRAFDILKYEV